MGSRVQVLVAAMHQEDFALAERLHLQSDAIIANQCSRCENAQAACGPFTVRMLSRPERGVGLNRNVALLHATGEFLLFADDDEVLADGYADAVARAFDENPQADGIIFNIGTLGTDMGRRQNTAVRRVRPWNALNYGAVRLAVRASSVRRENLTFHTCFGGGTRYNAGEDTLFITDMLRHGLKLYTHPFCIAAVDQTASTWFTGYDEKYLHDKGALFAAVSRFWARGLCLQDLARHPQLCRESGLTFPAAYRVMVCGIRDFAALNPFTKEERV